MGENQEPLKIMAKLKYTSIQNTKYNKIPFIITASETNANTSQPKKLSKSIKDSVKTIHKTHISRHLYKFLNSSKITMRGELDLVLDALAVFINAALDRCVYNVFVPYESLFLNNKRFDTSHILIIKNKRGVF